MNTGLRLRVMTPADLPFADSIRAMAGWNQTVADWRRFLATVSDGCFIAEWEGERAGTATTTVHSSDLAWIGMVLVHPDFRRRGIGRALLEHCIDHLRARGVKCIKLDATPLGKKVYDHIGFTQEWTLSRWECPRVCALSAAKHPRMRAWRAGDASLVEEVDRKAFGVSRGRLLGELAEQSHSAFVAESEASGVEGFGFLREGSRASYLGPIAAMDERTGIGLIETVLSERTSEAVFWDIPDSNTAAVEWARTHGFSVQRQLIRMYLGENCTPGDPAKQFALAGPEVG